LCQKKFKVDGKNKKEYRLGDFFRRHWRAYSRSPKEYIKAEQYKAVNALMSCRTALLGVEVYVCEQCGEVSEVYHSCNNRFCPTCSWKDTLDWAERIQSNMLRIKHRHVVFTLPHKLHKLMKDNDELLYNVLLRSSAATFKDWFSHKHNLKIGIIEVLHTYGEKKEYHPHVHMILSWGGIDKSTGALKEIKNEYVNYNFLQKKFRAKYEDELIRLNDTGKLIHDYADRKTFMQFVKRINKTDWVLHLEPAMDTPTKVIRYIGRYSKRACLSEYKITKIEGEYISFRYKDYKDRDANNVAKEKILRLHYNEFFPRLLQHVPIPYFRLVRYYGLYSNHGRIPEEYKTQQGEEKDQGQKTEEEVYDIKKCKVCKRDKILVCIYFERREVGERNGSEFEEIIKRHYKRREKKAA